MVAVLLLPTAALMIFGWALYLNGFDFQEQHTESYAVSDFFSSVSTNTVPQSALSGGVNVAATTRDVVGKAASAVVSIHRQGVGLVASGVIINPDGYVITTLHSLGSPDTLEVHVQGSQGVKRYKTDIVKKHVAHDLVLLKLVTNDRFLFLKLAETQSISQQTPLIAIGKEATGQVVAYPGVLQRSDQVRQVAGGTLTHLMQTNALLSWQQSGGAVINQHADLVGIGFLLQGQGGTAEGFVVPSHVIHSHFQDVIEFNLAGQSGGAQTQPPATTTVAQQVESNPLNQPNQAKGMAAAWWDQARQQTRQEKLAVVHQNQQQQSPGALLAQNIAATKTVNTAGGQTRVAHIGAPGDSVRLIDLEHDSSFDLGFYKLDAIIGLMLLGVVAGAVGTLVPMGGGIVAVSGMMLLFGYGVYMVRPVLYITNLFTYGLAALRQLFAGVVITRRVKDLLPATIVGAVLGYFLGHNLYDHVIGYLLGLFALVMAAVVLYELKGNLQQGESHVRPMAKNQDDRIDNFLQDSSEVSDRSW
ncbi:MAG TPA: TSUP family transporter, partial [Gammaproteobacteria bacterium]|nr:TSUP family transporter [Gammaproteobacteria bacterium]